MILTLECRCGGKSVLDISIDNEVDLVNEWLPKLRRIFLASPNDKLIENDLSLLLKSMDNIKIVESRHNSMLSHGVARSYWK